jgi:succinylarginine dihydrolase
MTTTFELNMDGLVGPTHHYAGLSPGNLASTNNAFATANPQAAALQGIEKMLLLHKLGLKQAVLPPHQRPNLDLLYQLGFKGSPGEQVSKAFAADTNILSASFSASSMWTANAATVSASHDTKDKKVHFTAANLISNIHRHQEADFSAHLLQTIFSDNTFFTHHQPLPRTDSLGDEGAANHNRFCKDYSQQGVCLFVYGKHALPANNPYPRPNKYPARQTLEASKAIARTHGLSPNHTLYAQQTPEAIDQGVFHNDVISVANENVFLVHEDAFIGQEDVYDQIRRAVEFDIHILEIKRNKVSIKDAVNSYLFNSQLITLPNTKTKQMALIAPYECYEHKAIRHLLTEMTEDNSNPLAEVNYLDLKQSMQNGGGPACLRLRVPVTEDALKAMHQGVLINDKLLTDLDEWVKKHYRTELTVKDLADPLLINESFNALDELTNLLNIVNIYPFQR